MDLTKLRFGWNPDLPDHRDFMYAAPTPILQNIPPAADLTAQCPPVYDQGQLGSCTANAIAAAFQFDEMKQNEPNVFIPSRLFIYYEERALEGTVNEDSGAQIRDGIKVTATNGVCPETEWPYDIAKFTQKPSQKCFTDAKKYKTVTYQRLIQDQNTMKGCLAEGFPFVFGITVYESMMSADVAKTGVVPMPTTQEKVLGGHAIMGVGFDDKTQLFKFRNSWGTSWGDGGYGYLPYSYLMDQNLATDFWTIRATTDAAAGAKLRASAA
ncbi:MAG: C1 family peptidase [Acidobacteriaceae bacterium]|nr:C1 family peptidase [Acidobacteriaceae bacterium]